MKIKIKIRDSKTLLDSINALKKKIMDVEIDLTKPGIKSIANALLEIKEKVNQTTGFAELRDLMLPVVKRFDTPKSKEILIKIDQLDRLFKRNPTPKGRNDYWAWEKLLKYYYNIILNAAGLGSPDVKKEEKEIEETVGDSIKSEVKKELEEQGAKMMDGIIEQETRRELKEGNVKNINKILDEGDEDLKKLVSLMGEAHDKIMEALDLAEELENQDKIHAQLRYDLEDVEAPLSELDFEGESNPVEAMMSKFGIDAEVEEDLELDEEDVW